MELILMVNLAFSVVGFFFIYRMWREVKLRRDEYGENFNIPRGKNRERGSRKRGERRPPRDYGEYFDEYEDEEPEHGFSQDDVKRLQALIASAQMEGAGNDS